MTWQLLGIKCSKAFPLLVMKIPLLEYFATVSAKEFPLLSSSVAPAEEFALLDKDKDYSQSKTAPQEETGKGPASESSAKKKGITVVITTEDMQKRRNDVKARTTLLLALSDEHQLRFSKYETPKELWEAILKTFGGNEATKKTKKNQLKQYHLELMDVEIEQDDLNQKFLTSLAPEWLIYTIVWRNRDDLDTMSLDDVYNHLKVYEPEVQKKSDTNSQCNTPKNERLWDELYRLETSMDDVEGVCGAAACMEQKGEMWPF
nr:ribonuclease H-like domain-containing protein [Tanacetum cinerariifolium]